MFYIINKTTGDVVKKSDTPFNIDESVQPPDPFMQLKILRNETKPAFNAATEKLVITHTDDLQAFTRTFHFVKQPLTAEEIALKAEADAAEVTRLQIKAVYLDLKNGTGTAGERLVRIEKALAWLLRQPLK